MNHLKWSGLGSLAVLPLLVTRLAASPITLMDGNSSATIDAGSQSGLSQWLVDNRNVANQEWFWYGLEGSPEASLNSLPLLSSTQASASQLELVFGGCRFNVRVQYQLTGGNAGSGASDIAETVTINNTSCSTLSLQFFQYSDFLNQIPGADSLALYKGALNKCVEAFQTEGGVTCDAAFVSGANLAEAGLDSSILDRLNDGSASTFSDIAAAGPGYTTWVGQWNVCLARGGSFIISKDINVAGVPEPSAASLLALGLIGGAWRRRKPGRN